MYGGSFGNPVDGEAGCATERGLVVSSSNGGGWKPAFLDGDLHGPWICNFEVMDARLGGVDEQGGSCFAGEAHELNTDRLRGAARAK